MNARRGERRESWWATTGAFVTAHWMWLLFAWTLGIAMVLVIVWGGRDVWQEAGWHMRSLIVAASLLAFGLPMGIFTWRLWLDFRGK